MISPHDTHLRMISASWPHVLGYLRTPPPPPNRPRQPIGSPRHVSPEGGGGLRSAKGAPATPRVQTFFLPPFGSARQVRTASLRMSRAVWKAVRCCSRLQSPRRSPALCVRVPFACLQVSLSPKCGLPDAHRKRRAPAAARRIVAAPVPGPLAQGPQQRPAAAAQGSATCGWLPPSPPQRSMAAMGLHSLRAAHWAHADLESVAAMPRVPERKARACDGARPFSVGPVAYGAAPASVSHMAADAVASASDTDGMRTPGTPSEAACSASARGIDSDAAEKDTASHGSEKRGRDMSAHRRRSSSTGSWDAVRSRRGSGVTGPEEDAAAATDQRSASATGHPIAAAVADVTPLDSPVEDAADHRPALDDAGSADALSAPSGAAYASSEAACTPSEAACGGSARGSESDAATDPDTSHGADKRAGEDSACGRRSSSVGPEDATCSRPGSRSARTPFPPSPIPDALCDDVPEASWPGPEGPSPSVGALLTFVVSPSGSCMPLYSGGGGTTPSSAGLPRVDPPLGHSVSVESYADLLTSPKARGASGARTSAPTHPVTPVRRSAQAVRAQSALPQPPSAERSRSLGGPHVPPRAGAGVASAPAAVPVNPPWVLLPGIYGAATPPSIGDATPSSSPDAAIPDVNSPPAPCPAPPRAHRHTPAPVRHAAEAPAPVAQTPPSAPPRPVRPSTSVSPAAGGHDVALPLSSAPDAGLAAHAAPTTPAQTPTAALRGASARLFRPETAVRSLARAAPGAVPAHETSAGEAGPGPETVPLDVFVLRAEAVASPRTFGDPDAYIEAAVVTEGAGGPAAVGPRVRTPTIHGSSFPVWRAMLRLQIGADARALRLWCYDVVPLQGPVLIGEGALALEEAAPGAEVWVALRAGGARRGRVRVRLECADEGRLGPADAMGTVDAGNDEGAEQEPAQPEQEGQGLSAPAMDEPGLQRETELVGSQQRQGSPAGAGPGADTDTDAGVGADRDTGAEIGAGPDAGEDVDSAPGAGPGPGPGPGTDAGDGLGLSAQLDHGIRSKSRSESLLGVLERATQLLMDAGHQPQAGSGHHGGVPLNDAQENGEQGCQTPVRAPTPEGTAEAPTLESTVQAQPPSETDTADQRAADTSRESTPIEPLQAHESVVDIHVAIPDVAEATARRVSGALREARLNAASPSSPTRGGRRASASPPASDSRARHRASAPKVATTSDPASPRRRRRRSMSPASPGRRRRSRVSSQPTAPSRRRSIARPRSASPRSRRNGSDWYSQSLPLPRSHSLDMGSWHLTVPDSKSVPPSQSDSPPAADPAPRRVTVPSRRSVSGALPTASRQGSKASPSSSRRESVSPARSAASRRGSKASPSPTRRPSVSPARSAASRRGSKASPSPTRRESVSPARSAASRRGSKPSLSPPRRRSGSRARSAASRRGSKASPSPPRRRSASPPRSAASRRGSKPSQSPPKGSKAKKKRHPPPPVGPTTDPVPSATATKSALSDSPDPGSDEKGLGNEHGMGDEQEVIE